MRRDIQEIEREIFSKRDEHFEKQKMRRRALGRVVPIAGGAALVFALSFAVLPALRSGTADSDRERSAYTGGSEDGTIRPETELRDGNIMSTGAPMEGDPIGQTDQPAVLPGCAEETEEPGNYSSSGGDRPPWICGTPWLEGAELSIEELLNRGDHCHCEGERALVHTAVTFAGGEEVRRFSFEGEAGRQVLGWSRPPCGKPLCSPRRSSRRRPTAISSFILSLWIGKAAFATPASASRRKGSCFSITDS